MGAQQLNHDINNRICFFVKASPIFTHKKTDVKVGFFISSLSLRICIKLLTAQPKGTSANKD